MNCSYEVPVGYRLAFRGGPIVQSFEKPISWKDIRRTLVSKHHDELLQLIRELYVLGPENKDFIHAWVLKTPASQHSHAAAPVRQSHKGGASTVAPKIRRLANVAVALRGGEHFDITRLTTIKSLCEEPKAAAQFALHIAKLTHRKMQEKTCPSHLEPEQWEHYKQLVDEAIRQMERSLEEPTEQEVELLQPWLSDIRAVQDTYENHRWGPVRIIKSTEVLIVELALSCLVYPAAAAQWGYRIAREYAERYDPRYGTGLIPESAPMVEDIAVFWCQYHVGQSLRAWR